MARLYCKAATTSTQHLGISSVNFLGWYAYPQWLTEIFRFLFGSLPPRLAFALYSTVSGLVLFTVYRIVAPSPRWLLGLCLWPLTFFIISFGQITPYLLLGLVLSLNLGRWQAGILSSLFWLKPQLAIGVGLLHFSRHDWPALISYLAIGGMVILASLFAPGREAIGSDFWQTWFFENPLSVSISGLVPFWPLQISFFALAMALSFVLAWRKQLTPLLALFFNLAFVPYLLSYDLPLLLPLITSTALAVSLFAFTVSCGRREQGWVVPLGALAILTSTPVAFLANSGQWWVFLSIPVLAKPPHHFLTPLARILPQSRTTPSSPHD